MSNWYDEVLKHSTRLASEQLIKIAAPNCKEPNEWSAWISMYCSKAKYDITGEELAMFLAQISHESNDLNVFEENLNYSAKRLTQVWPSRFKSVEYAQQFAYNPEALANKVYGNRLGNRGESSGDGYRYRGSGLIQLTGRANFKSCAEDTGLDIVENPDLLRTDKESAVISACWYWDKYVTMGSVEKVTKAINGSYNGLEDRRERFERIVKFMENR